VNSVNGCISPHHAHSAQGVDGLKKIGELKRLAYRPRRTSPANISPAAHETGFHLYVDAHSDQPIPSIFKY